MHYRRASPGHRLIQRRELPHDAWDALTWPGLVLVTYFIGGLPTAYLVTRLVSGQDIRLVGDSNVGAANVYRSVGPKAGLAVGAIDIARARWLSLVKDLWTPPALEMAAGVAALAGHNWPVHLGFVGDGAPATAVEY